MKIYQEITHRKMLTQKLKIRTPTFRNQWKICQNIGFLTKIKGHFVLGYWITFI